MKKTGIIVPLAIAGLVTITSCNNQQRKEDTDTNVTETSKMSGEAPISMDIPYILAERYFVKNNVKAPLPNPKIESQEEFDRVFGTAAVMGDGGIPTVIDFNKQYAIVVVLPETDMYTTLDPVSLQKSESDVIVFSYRKTIGEKLSHVSVPALIIVVDKSFSGDVVTKEWRE